MPTIDEARAIDTDQGGSFADPIRSATEIDVEAAARAMAAIEAVRLRDANAEQLASARRQLDQIGADKQAERDRLARYREAGAAHDAAMTEYNARLEAAQTARRRWERDVAACQAGDWDRCGPSVAPN